MIRSSALLVVLGAVGLCGCFDRQIELTVNPDGSGKLTFVCDDPPYPFVRPGISPSSEPTEEENAKRALQSFLNSVEGVEAWSDLSSGTKDKRTLIKGTGYFPDVTKLRLPKFATVTGLAKTDDGGMLFNIRLEMLDLDTAKSVQTQPATQPTSQPTQEDIRRAIEVVRTDIAEHRNPEIEKAFETARSKYVLHLPGPVRKTAGFEKTDANTVAVQLEGKKYLAAVDAILADDAVMEEMMRHPESRGSMILKKLFGVSDPNVSVRIGAAKPLFDYAAEVKKAKAVSAK